MMPDLCSIWTLRFHMRYHDCTVGDSVLFIVWWSSDLSMDTWLLSSRTEFESRFFYSQSCVLCSIAFCLWLCFLLPDFPIQWNNSSHLPSTYFGSCYTHYLMESQSNLIRYQYYCHFTQEETILRGWVPCRESHSLSVAFDPSSLWGFHAALLSGIIEILMTKRTMDSVLFWRAKGCAIGRVLPGFLLEEGREAEDSRELVVKRPWPGHAIGLEALKLGPLWGNMTDFQDLRDILCPLDPEAPVGVYWKSWVPCHFPEGML